MTSPPSTGANLLRKAPNPPGMPVATKAATAKVGTATRILRWVIDCRYFQVTEATMVMAIGAIQDTCSFHSTPMLCHSDVAPLDSSSRCDTR